MFYVVVTTFFLTLSTPIYLLLFLPGISLIIIGYLKFAKFYEKYRITPDLAKPWERPNWTEAFKKWVKYWTFNKFIVNPLFLLVMGGLFGFNYRCNRDTFPDSL